MRADRLLSLLMMLQIKGRVTAQELAERLEVSERTIYRDIEALSIAGVPVYAERGPGGGCMLAEGYRTNLTGLKETEVRTLFMPDVAGPLSDLGVSKELETALLKLLAALPSAHQRNIERTRQRLYIEAVGWYHSNEAVPFLQILQSAVWQDRKVRLTYRKNNGEPIERIVDPLGLVAKAGIWYMVAVSHEDLRVFRVSRVRNVVLTDEQCHRPEGFHLERYWAEWSHNFLTSLSKYPIKIRVSPLFLSILPQVLGEEMHSRIEEAGPPDAEGWLTLSLMFETLEHARSVMLGFGTMVEVMEPLELRTNIIQLATGILEFYKAREQS